jgi:hypothetical protein
MLLDSTAANWRACQRGVAVTEGRRNQEPLRGNVTPVQRVGDTVRRATGEWTPAVHALLKHLEHAGFEAAPRVLGIDDEGREVLSFIEGDVPQGDPAPVLGDQAIVQVARLLRRLHDITAGFVLPPSLSWRRTTIAARGRRVVCHNDVAPRNTVFRGNEVVAFLDWDGACPAPGVVDVAGAAWQFVPLVNDEECARRGWLSTSERLRRLRLFCDEYDLSHESRLEFAGVATRLMASHAGGIQRYASQGSEAFRALAARGIPERIRDEMRWTQHHSEEIQRALL